MGKEESIGDRIRQRRLVCGWAQRDLGRHAYVSGSMISRLESGEQRTLELEAAVRIAQALGVSVEWLAYGDTADATPRVPSSVRSPATVAYAGRMTGPCR
jgi:transcriptional regulator with XRE-family HTH domain